MNYIIPIKIEFGENTCAKEPGVFCHLLTPSVVQDGACALFGKVFDRDGWIIRHPECMAKAVVA